MDNSKARIRKAPGVDTYIVEDEWLLFSPATQAMFRLNTSAAFIWACIEEGLNFEEIKEKLAETFSVDAERTESDLHAVIGEWRRLGLLEGGSGAPEIASVAEAAQTPVLAFSASSIDGNAYTCQRYYRLLDAVIRIRYREPDIQAALDAVLVTSGQVQEQPHDASIDIWRAGQEYYVIEGGEIMARCENKETLPPVLLAHTVGAAYLKTECLIGLHAALVSRGNDCVLFPAVSGSGKSTLTAALVASGYQYGTDELVLIKKDTHQPLTAPLGMSLKPGSWPVLKNYYPYLASLPVFLRPDGKQVRYLLPQIHAQFSVDNKDSTVRAIVFPRYRPENPASLTSITSADALCRLTEAGYDVAGGLDRESVAELIAWMCEQDCYELLFDDLNEAVARIGELLP